VKKKENKSLNRERFPEERRLQGVYI